MWQNGVTLRAFGLAITVAVAAGQGLQLPPEGLGASGYYEGMYESFNTQFKGSQAWQAAYKAAPKAACSPAAASSVCSSGGAASVDTYAQLMLATSPSSYSSLDGRWAGGRLLLQPARDQRPCKSCAAHAVLAAAEAAVASATGKDVREVGALSVQQLAFCGKQLRSCSADWTLEGALGQLVEGGPLLLEECLPYAPDARLELTKAQLCQAQRRCEKASSIASQGTFEYVPITYVWQAQRHIRQHGAVITRFDILDDFKPFFSNFGNTYKVYSAKPGARAKEPHAVILVGYDNPKGFWLARNSWGATFADAGLFRVAFKTANVLRSGSTYGIIWTPRRPELRPQLPLKPGTGGCQTYTATSTDYLSKVAFRAGVALEKLLADNLGTIKDPGAPLAGRALRICGASAAPAPGPARVVGGGTAGLLSAKLLSNQSLNMDELGNLYVAMSPQSFDARLKKLVPPARHQGVCTRSVHATMINAAQAALSAALVRDATSNPWSMQQFAYCLEDDFGLCWRETTFTKELQRLAEHAGELVLEACLPYTPPANTEPSRNCSTKCSTKDPDLALGRFSYISLSSLWEAQRHIRRWGAVATRLNMYINLTPFFERNPYGVYPGHEGSELLDTIAILLVGYNNKEEYWIFQGTWGPHFAASGYGKISYNASVGILDPSNTFGVIFEPSTPRQLPYTICPHPARVGCYLVTPPRRTWVPQLTDDLRLNLEKFLKDNIKEIADVGRPLDGGPYTGCSLSPQVLSRLEFLSTC